MKGVTEQMQNQFACFECDAAGNENSERLHMSFEFGRIGRYSKFGGLIRYGQKSGVFGDSLQKKVSVWRWLVA